VLQLRNIPVKPGLMQHFSWSSTFLQSTRSGPTPVAVARPGCRGTLCPGLQEFEKGRSEPQTWAASPTLRASRYPLSSKHPVSPFRSPSTYFPLPIFIPQKPIQGSALFWLAGHAHVQAIQHQPPAGPGLGCPTQPC
jgi:hypothetical protein